MPLTRVPLGAPAGRERWTVTYDGHDYLVLVHDEGVVVTDARCPHRRLPLAEGLVRDGALVCPGHWYAFDLTDGRCRNAAEAALPLHPVVEQDGALFALVTTTAPPLSWSERLRAYATAAREGQP